MKCTRNTVTKQIFARSNSIHCLTHQVFRCSLTMACSTNVAELSNSNFDSFLSQLIDKDFNDILSDHQLPVSTLAAPNQSKETQLHPTFAEPKTDSDVKLAKASGVPKTQLGLPHGA